MSKNLATHFGDLSLGQHPVPSRKAKGVIRAAAQDTLWGRAFSLWHNSEASAISNFAVTWTVPNARTDDSGEYSLFNSLGWTQVDVRGRPTVSANLRPVLRWAVPDTGGAAGWTVSSLYIGQDSTSSTAPVTVNSGDIITGIITLTSSDTEYHYTCCFTDSNNVEISGTQMNVVGPVYVNAIVGFEWKDLNNTLAISPNPIVTSSIVIQTGDTNPTVAWKLGTFQITPDESLVQVRANNASAAAGQVPLVEFDLQS